MAELNPNFFCRVHGEQPGSPYEFSIACTEVNVYLEMKYFLNMDDKFMDFRKKLAKALINNSYTNDNACGSPENVRKRQ